MNIDLKKIKYKDLGFFRFRKIKDKILLTNDYGGYIFLSKKDFDDFLEGKLAKNKEPYLALVKNNFVKNELDITKAIEKYRNKKSFLHEGPCLHIIIVTLRCNQRCIYCHASAQDLKAVDKDMDKKTAKKAVEMIFKTTSPYVDIEFQGGEPLLNWPVIKYIIEEAKKKNKKAKKELIIKLVSNFSLMTEEKYKFLLDNMVSLCTSLDGPKELHNKNRPLLGEQSYKSVAYWIKRFNKNYPRLKKKGYVWKMAALTTISRFSLARPKEIVNEYIKLGFSNIFLRPLDPFGFSQNSWKKIGYSSNEFIKFYTKALDYIIKLNIRGKEFKERYANFFLTKILTDKEPNNMDLRSPCGAGIGQLAYNYNGDVYTCDEGRMVSMMGDESFKLGNVFENNYKDIVSSPIVRTLCSASCLEGLAGCCDCAYLPYCGTCPILNYFEQGNIFSQMPNSERCKINKAILDYLFEKLQNKEVNKVFNKWVKSLY